jgi:acylphosphatase
MRICQRYVIKGRVQGVYYRQSTLEMATALALTGYVKNNADGTVECVACGPYEALQSLVEWLWQGPDAAEVTELLTYVAIPQNYLEFKIKA